MRLPRPRLTSIQLSLVTCLYILLVLNSAFWARSFRYFHETPFEGAAFAAILALLLLAFTIGFSVKYVLKPVLIFLIFVAASASYFADEFGVLITTDVMRDAFATNAGEAGEYFTASLFLHLFLYAVVPSAVIVWVKVVHRPFLRKALVNTGVITVCLALAAGLLLTNFEGIASTLREHRDLIASFNPGGPVGATVSLGVKNWKSGPIVVQPLGRDARKGSRIAAAAKPVVTIIVAGETARARNFSLDGYERETDPELRAANVINFPHATSCGTATAVSIPCMFSVYTRKEYSDRKARSTENLMDVLQHAGIQAVWWDNNSSSKGVADRIPYTRMPTRKDDPNCSRRECRDQVLVDALGPFLDQVKDDTVLVLHQLGSHGPAYSLRYPPEFARFKPDCQDSHLSQCTHEEVVNAYDNTILYTDHILGEVIRMLKERQDRLSGAMLYLSDHGESLGENGIYLHSAPYFMAPADQTHIPFMLWLSDGFAHTMGIDQGCMRKKASEPVSQDNLFHSVLGMMDIHTSVLDPKLDLFASCAAGAARPGYVGG